MMLVRFTDRYWDETWTAWVSKDHYSSDVANVLYINGIESRVIAISHERTV